MYFAVANLDNCLNAGHLHVDIASEKSLVICLCVEKTKRRERVVAMAIERRLRSPFDNPRPCGQSPMLAARVFNVNDDEREAV